MPLAITSAIVLLCVVSVLVAVAAEGGGDSATPEISVRASDDYDIRGRLPGEGTCRGVAA